MLKRRLPRASAGPLLLAAMLCGCAQTVSGLPPAPRTIAPQAGVAAEIPPYRLQVGDVLGVRLLLNPELNEEVTVRPDGRISTVLAEACAPTAAPRRSWPPCCAATTRRSSAPRG